MGDAAGRGRGGDAGGSTNATLMTSAALPSNGSASVGDGKLTVKLQRYGWVVDSTATDRDLDYVGLTQVTGDAGTPDDPTDDPTAPTLITAAFDLEALAAAGAGAKTTVNGPKWVDSVKATVQTQRDQIATLQSLGTRTAATRASEATAWQTAVDAIQYQLFGGDLPVKLAEAYAEDDALDLLDRVLDALANANNLFAALDPEGTGIFDHFDSDSGTDGVQEGNYIRYDTNADSRRWEFIENNRTLGNFLGEREHKVVASLGTTDYARFGVWYRIGAVSAQRNGRADDGSDENKSVKKGEGGPGAFAYSPLDPTMAGSATNPAFPLGGSARYMGETVAIMDEDVLTGTARVDVSWLAATATGFDFDSSDGSSNVGSMSVTLGGLADSTGDPLTLIDGANVADNAAVAGQNEGREIAEIVFSNMVIQVGAAGGRSGQLIVGTGTEGAGDDAGTYTYGELSLTAASQVRYRLAAIGSADVASTATAAGLGALFVGQGVDGPLGVIGTFTLTDANVARIRPPTGANVRLEEWGVTIHGGFGADVP